MTVYPIASEAKITETLAVIGQDVMGDSEVELLKQIVVALANRNAGGGDPIGNTVTALGGSPIARSEVPLLQQILVLAATAA